MKELKREKNKSQHGTFGFIIVAAVMVVIFGLVIWMILEPIKN